MKCHKARGTGHCDPHFAGGSTFLFFNHPLTAPTSKVPVFLEEGEVGERSRMAVEGGARDAAVVICHLLSRGENQKVLLVWDQHRGRKR